jgi:hypothetical protein
MAGTKLDGAGVAKLRTLEDAQTMLQRVHGLVEQFAMAQKRAQPTTMYGMQIKRAATPLVGLLKPQFGLISDQVAALNLVASRGGNETARIRALREAVAMTRTALDVAAGRVKEQHAVEEEAREEGGGRRDE